MQASAHVSLFDSKHRQTSQNNWLILFGVLNVFKIDVSEHAPMFKQTILFICALFDQSLIKLFDSFAAKLTHRK